MPTDWRKRASAFFFPTLSRGWMVDASCLLLVLAGCAIDLNTNPAYSPLPFFVLPIIYVAWFSPRQLTSWVCIALMTSSDFIVAYSDDFRISSVEGYSIVTQIATVMLVYWTVRQLRASAINLRDAKSRLESLNREKDLLFGVISHDLRGALGVMLASSRLMHRGERLRDDQIRMIADRNKTAAERSLTILEDLLEWSRSQMLGTTLKTQPVPVGPVVERCVEAAADLSAEKNVRLSAREVPPGLAASADERALRVILRNLIGNALKFTGEGGAVEVFAWSEGANIVVSVKDSGIGISEQRLRQLLSGGATSSASGVRGEAGTGFGLSMCRDILQRFGGRMDARSTAGQGSEFFVYLPRTETAPNVFPAQPRRDAA
ncbi:MAG TPA: HAMP domain-containing sensor histidine kinase [Rhizomicrobium sp.]|nr:HAMP domain-containing sensor histidine kinase [Rhizomicrobium sp.]